MGFLTALAILVYYHLGLAHYLSGDFHKAASGYEGCLRNTRSDEDTVAACTWLYPSLTRAGAGPRRGGQGGTRPNWPRAGGQRKQGVPRSAVALQGVKTEEEVGKGMAESPLALSTVAYGIGLWHLLGGRPERAREYFRKATSGTA